MCQSVGQGVILHLRTSDMHYVCLQQTIHSRMCPVSIAQCTCVRISKQLTVHCRPMQLHHTSALSLESLSLFLAPLEACVASSLLPPVCLPELRLDPRYTCTRTHTHTHVCGLGFHACCTHTTAPRQPPACLFLRNDHPGGRIPFNVWL